MYIIYEIKGKKIGCTRKDAYDIRQHMQKDIGKMIVLEEHLCIYEASNREIELQKQYGYEIDSNPYWWVIQNFQAKSKTSEAKAKRVSSIDWQDLAAKAHATVRISKKGWRPINAFKTTLIRKGKNNKHFYSKTFYKKYDSLTNAALDLNLRTGGIHKILNPNNIAKTLKGYTFEDA